MKKIIAILVSAMLLLAALPTAALAHGHSTSSSKHKVCSVKKCTKTGTHKHNGKSYAGHHAGDGHSYHRSNHH